MALLCFSQLLTPGKVTHSGVHSGQEAMGLPAGPRRAQVLLDQTTGKRLRAALPDATGQGACLGQGAAARPEWPRGDRPHEAAASSGRVRSIRA